MGYQGSSQMRQAFVWQRQSGREYQNPRRKEGIHAGNRVVLAMMRNLVMYKRLIK